MPTTGQRRRGAGAHSKPHKTGAAHRTGHKRDGAPESPVLVLARQLRSWTDSVLGVAGSAADVSMLVAKSVLRRPAPRAALEKAGTALRGMREAAGLSLKELGRAINLEDPVLLDLVENGKAALPFEIILRLAAVLGRNDPLPFVMQLTRTYNPEVWKTLESIGVGRLVLQAGREREFANIYRSNDAARRLSDPEFAAVLAFASAAFNLAMTFRDQREIPAPHGRTGLRGGKAGKSKS